MGLDIDKTSAYCSKETSVYAYDSNSACEMLRIFMILVAAVMVLIVLYAIVVFLLDLRSQNSKTHYRIFLGLWTVFLAFLTRSVANFVGPLITRETRNKVLITGLIILIVFLWMYNTLASCVDKNNNMIKNKNKNQNQTPKTKSRELEIALKIVRRVPKGRRKASKVPQRPVQVPAKLALKWESVQVEVHAEEDADPPSYGELYPPPPYSAVLQGLQG